MNMRHGLKNVRTGFLVALILTSAAHARDWAFSKDTVYEWATGGDSVSFMNNAADTLRFDSIGVEMVRPGSTIAAGSFYLATLQGQPFYLRLSSGKVSGYSPGSIALAPGQTGKAFQFTVDDQLTAVTKSLAIAAGDTLVARLIFLAASGKGRDTLMVMGKQSGPISLRPYRSLKSTESHGALVDPRGKHIEKSVEGARVPRTPTLSTPKN